MTEALVARQPIFDDGMRVFAYELLFRGGREDQTAAIKGSGEAATSTVLMNWATGVGLEDLTGDRPAFVNVSRDFLAQLESVTPAPLALGLEIPREVHGEPDLVPVVQELSEADYTIILDDCHPGEVLPDMLAAADLAKLDVNKARERALEAELADLAGAGVGWVAEKVESQESLEACRALGFGYFQGFFFTKPQTVAHRDLPADRMQLIRLLAQLHDPDTTLREVTDIVAQDVNLSYRLLRLVNSPLFPTRVEVDSIGHAVTLLGMEGVRTYASWLAMIRGSNKPNELTVTLLVRARFSWLLADAMGRMDAPTAFTVGLFSGLEALTDMPMEEALRPLPFSDTVREALLERAGPLGHILAAVEGYEGGDWSALGRINVSNARIHEAYLDAVRWAENLASL